MNIIRKSNLPFTQVSNVILNDHNLSLRAKGLYAYLFSKPDGWNFHYAAMEKEVCESEEVIRNALKELASLGYITKDRFKDEHGRLGGIIITFHAPVESSNTEKTKLGKSMPGKNQLGKNQAGKINALNNTEVTNTNILNNTDSIIKQSAKKGIRFENSEYFSADIPQSFLNCFDDMKKNKATPLIDFVDPFITYQSFKDYWVAVPGAKGVKLDWLATWRNWVRNTKPSTANKPKETKNEHDRRYFESILNTDLSDPTIFG